MILLCNSFVSFFYFLIIAMPVDHSKPPDPLIEEFCSLTGMKAEGLSQKSFVPSDGNKGSRPRGRPKGVKNRVRSVKVKVQSPGSASVGAGALLKCLGNLKIAGKGRSRSDASPMFESGKRPNSCNSPVDDALIKVLDKIAYDKNISDRMVFNEGVKDSVDSIGNVVKDTSFYSIKGNDGSFIKKPLDPPIVGVNDASVCMENKGDVGMGGVDPCIVSNGTSKLNMADVEHIKVENTRKTIKVVLMKDKEDSAFVFGKRHSQKGILNNPPVGLSKVQFGPSLFYKSSNVWSFGLFGMNNSKTDRPINIESFAEKMKKGVEDRELQMNLSPQCVSKNSNGSRRISISMEYIKKGSKACALQLYGYFVGTSMDYKVVNANLSRMWRVHGISDITKTSAGLFYFKFKSEEGMKAVLESGP
ncbi:reverse transcriptase zinc-binding domain-containing protein [Tanacetum coccineum]